MEKIEEIWKDVPGYEGIYQVTNNGRVRSLDRYVDTKNNSKRFCGGKEIILKPNPWGYLSIALYSHQKSYTTTVHVLVAITFIGPRPPKLEVNHKNGIKTDNRVENLEYVTASENQLHAIRTGLVKRRFGSNGRNVVLTEDKVKEILELKDILSQDKLAKKFNVSRGCITDIYYGFTWNEITGLPKKYKPKKCK